MNDRLVLTSKTYDMIQKDQSHPKDAFLFLIRAIKNLLAEKKSTGMFNAEEIVHSSQTQAKKEFGPMAEFVLQEWGIRSSEQLSQMVGSLRRNGVVDSSLQANEDEYRRIDFFGNIFDPEKEYCLRQPLN